MTSEFEDLIEEFLRVRGDLVGLVSESGDALEQVHASLQCGVWARPGPRLRPQLAARRDAGACGRFRIRTAGRRLTPSLQVEARFHQLLVLVVRDREPGALADDRMPWLSTAMLATMRASFSSRPICDQPAEQLGAEALALLGVGDEDGELGLVRAAQLAQAADGEDRRARPVGVALLGHQRHLAVVVDEADARQPLVRDALARASSAWK